jgi:hypothetical protein
MRRNKKMRAGSTSLSKFAVPALGLVAIVALSYAVSQPLQKSQYQNNARAASLYPSDTKLSLVPVPTVARPAYLVPMTDPTFGTKITRISDQTAFKDTYKAIRHTYAKNQPWNADGSLLMLGYEWNAHILDGNTYAYLRDINLGNMMPLWSNTQPTVIYARSTDGTSNANPTNQFLKVDVNTGQKTILHTFTEYDMISIGEEEGNISDDDHYVALMAKKGTATYALVYDIVNDLVVSQLDLGGKWPDWVSVSRSGSYVLFNWATDGLGHQQGIEIYSQNFTSYKNGSYRSHADIGYDSNGNEVLVSFSSGLVSGSSVVATRLDTGAHTMMLDKTNGGFGYGHISCRNLRRPGWCYLSNGESNTNIEGFDEAFALKLDGSMTVERFAHEHHVPLTQYYEQPQAVPNQDGSKVLFSSNWDGGSVVYDYIAEMQAVTPIPTATSSPVTPTGVVATVTPTATTTPVSNDSTPPTVVLSTPSNGQTIPSTRTLNVSSTASDTSGIYSLKIVIDGAVKKTCSSSACSYAWDTRKISAGSHIIKAIATDNSASRNVNSTTITVYR